jgi:hypothetical protein
VAELADAPDLDLIKPILAVFASPVPLLAKYITRKYLRVIFFGTHSHTQQSPMHRVPSKTPSVFLRLFTHMREKRPTDHGLCEWITDLPSTFPADQRDNATWLLNGRCG